jgi:hypothetical protein
MSSTISSKAKKSTYGDKNYTIVQVDWISDAGGAATAALNLYGFLVKMITLPGSPAPTDLYDVTLIDGISGLDACRGLLADQSATVTKEIYGIAKNSSDVAPCPILLAGDYTLTIANAGNAKAGTCYLYLVEGL